MTNDQPTGYDVIGDIHGRYDKLERLAARLGYRQDGGAFVPPSGIKALFLGDLIDPKPGHAIPAGVKRTLRVVRAMVDRGHALCLMGNHEFNALRFHTMGPAGLPLQAHDPRNIRMHQGTLDDFPDHGKTGGEWREIWLPWMAGLPLFLDLGGIRAVHACWHGSSIDLAKTTDLRKVDQLAEASDTGKALGNAVSTLLKGIEVPLPAECGFMDETGSERRRIRARWWQAPRPGMLCRDLVFPENERIPETTMEESAFGFFEPYGEGEPPVFIGHYLKRSDSPLMPEKVNLACLDHGAGVGGPLVAYCWRGEHELRADSYVTDEA